MDVQTAEATAMRELAALPTRLAHVRAVAELAHSVGNVLPPQERSTLVAAAHLHDIGYAPRLARTGFHALDGARWLQAQGELRLANLVAHHTGALHEARSRGLEQELAVFLREDSPVSDLLSWCDLNRGPHGEPERARARSGGSLTSMDRFSVGAELWYKELEQKIEDGTRSKGTRDGYERALRNHVLPA
jgi:hypothetical protein